MIFFTSLQIFLMKRTWEEVTKNENMTCRIAFFSVFIPAGFCIFLSASKRRVEPVRHDFTVCQFRLGHPLSSVKSLNERKMQNPAKDEYWKKCYSGGHILVLFHHLSSSIHQKDLQGRKKNHRLDFPVACVRFNLETAAGREKAVQGIYVHREF